ncbi:MAG: hypothetical protein AVDCRST_MAG52-2005 [uncultured Blastococcus sp.]|uniref:Uncharacterized protein n=1 Tax=uncultured Blastococcus sp. TaxID=217144 RepID=A0A6J4IEZ1_9ACTN|nr:MAG: hypothetical protein AVDCRST_MAG52-2005 [uncultured Blastococcus sp.]
MKTSGSRSDSQPAPPLTRRYSSRHRRRGRRRRPSRPPQLRPPPHGAHGRAVSAVAEAGVDVVGPQAGREGSRRTDRLGSG